MNSIPITIVRVPYSWIKGDLQSPVSSPLPGRTRPTTPACTWTPLTPHASPGWGMQTIQLDLRRRTTLATAPTAMERQSGLAVLTTWLSFSTTKSGAQTFMIWGRGSLKVWLLVVSVQLLKNIFFFQKFSKYFFPKIFKIFFLLQEQFLDFQGLDNHLNCRSMT